MGDSERAKDDEEDEQVVDRQTLLDEIGRDVLPGVLATEHAPDDEREPEPEADPQRRPRDRGRP
jgi:hypothetical protein